MAGEIQLNSVTLATESGGVASIDSSVDIKGPLNASGSAPLYACRAWVNFNGTFGTSPFTIANGGIRASGNVSSITDNGQGYYTINFTTAMPDANYSITGNVGTNNNYPTVPTVSGVLHINAQTTSPYKSPPTTSSCRVVAAPDNQIASSFDPEYVDVSIFR